MPGVKGDPHMSISTQIETVEQQFDHLRTLQHHVLSLLATCYAEIELEDEEQAVQETCEDDDPTDSTHPTLRHLSTCRRTNHPIRHIRHNPTLRHTINCRQHRQSLRHIRHNSTHRHASTPPSAPIPPGLNRNTLWLTNKPPCYAHPSCSDSLPSGWEGLLYLY